MLPTKIIHTFGTFFSKFPTDQLALNNKSEYMQTMKDLDTLYENSYFPIEKQLL